MPGAMRLGIVGGGQLGRMLALSAANLGVDCSFVDPAPDAGAAIVARQIEAPYDAIDALIELAESTDVVTFEFENVPAPALDAIASHGQIAPPPQSLAASQDRLTEKQLFDSLGIAVAPYRNVESLAELELAVEQLGRPAILKTRRLGYDGKGQARIEEASDLLHAWEQVGELPSVLEAMVPFDRELSVIATRSASGEVVVYPLTENVHRAGILRTSTVPAAGETAHRAQAETWATTLLEELNHVGTLALELFVRGDELIANEFAPRVHNSGHWTIDAAPTSQFENHVRAVLDLPLGAVRPAQPCTMINLIGGMPDAAEVLAIPGAKLHDYAKQPRAGRKIGHITVVPVDGHEHETSVREAIELAERTTV